MKTLLIAITTGALLVNASTGAIAAKVGDTRASALADAQKRFSRIDADKDGKVTAAEMTAFLTARANKSGGEVNPKRADRMFKRGDANSDGAITLQEMTAEAGTRFDMADANHNGTIDAGEEGGGSGGNS